MLHTTIHCDIRDPIPTPHYGTVDIDLSCNYCRSPERYVYDSYVQMHLDGEVPLYRSFDNWLAAVRPYAVSIIKGVVEVIAV